MTLVLLVLLDSTHSRAGHTCTGSAVWLDRRTTLAEDLNGCTEPARQMYDSVALKRTRAHHTPPPEFLQLNLFEVCPNSNGAPFPVTNELGPRVVIDGGLAYLFFHTSAIKQ